MLDQLRKINDPFGLVLSVLPTVIAAFGAPVGPIIVALIIGVAIGCWITDRPTEAGK
jgi:hypothetical protein